MPIAIFCLIGGLSLPTQSVLGMETPNKSGAAKTREHARNSTVNLSAQSATHLESFCLDCHGADPDDIAGSFDLAKVLESGEFPTPDLADLVLSVMETRRMPPIEAEQPPQKQTERTIEELEISLTSTLNRIPAPEYPTVRRMNRLQYNNAVIDLFQLNCNVFTLPERIMREHGKYFNPASGVMPKVVSVGNRPLGKSQMIEPRLAGVAAFPQDLRAEHGFDNQSDHLSMSPLLMGAFLQLGSSITQSPDFNARRVGIWNTFFAPPSQGVSQKEAIRTRLQGLLNIAFRGNASADAVERYVSYASRRIDSGADFTSAMRDVAAAIISSPKFFYLYSPDDTSTAGIQPNSDPNQETSAVTHPASKSLNTATRLALLLWGSIPDAELIDLAVSGKLEQQEVLLGQIDRMLTDRRLKRFCDSFPSQWLQLERLISSLPNRELYPDFYYSKYRRSMHMMLEPLLLFETVLIENRSILELIDPPFSYRSGLLEQAYGDLKNSTEPLPGGGGQVTSLTFSRIPITDRRSGGVITNAAVMTMTSSPDRTQPITRGAWVAGVIFNSPPKPPPADVPPLDEDQKESDQALTLREQLKQHRERSDCRGCHEQIDPLGFALENYDAVGRWREHYKNGLAINTSGTIFGDNHYSSPTEFKDAILDQRDRFALAFTEHLSAYALARPLTVHDRSAVREIAGSITTQDYRLQDLIKKLITSPLFQSR